MTKIFYVSVVLCVLLLTWCGSSPDVTTKTEKQPFFITTAPHASLRNVYSLKKTGKLASSSEIIVAAQIGGRVVSLNKWIGDTVAQWEGVIQLQETSGVYSFWSQKASVAITQAQLSYEQTMLNLEKAIQDTKFGIEQATNQADNASLNSNVSAATLQLQSAKENFERAKLDYQTKLLADEQTLNNFWQTASNLVNDVTLLYEWAIIEADKLMWVSTLQQTNNDLFENMLWARNTATKFAAEDALRQALIYQTQLESFAITAESSQLAEKLGQLVWYIRNLQPMLSAIDTMLEYTITWPTYSEAQLATHRATIDGLQAQTQGQITAITAQINAIQSFLRTYKETQASIAKAVDLSEQSYKTAQANLETVQSNSKVQVSSLQNTLQTTEKNKETTEKALKNTIKQAQIAYNEAWFQLGKLRSSAPIAGTITDILVDMGQDVAPGTPLYKMNSVWAKEIEITLTQEEANSLVQNTPVQIVFWAKTTTWLLSQISTSPTAGVSYKAIVTTQSNEIPAWSLVDVIFEQPTEHLVVPLNRIQLLSTTEWQLTVRDGETLENIRISLGKLKGTQIEIITPLPATQDIVTSDTKQYDPEKHAIQIKKNQKDGVFES